MIENNPKKPYRYYVKLYWSEANYLMSWLRYREAEFGWGIDPCDKLYHNIYFGDETVELIRELARICEITDELEVLEVV